MKKLVLYCQASKGEGDDIYGQNGFIINGFRKALGEDIVYVNFGGYLDSQKFSALVEAAKDADVVALDAWSHPEDKGYQYSMEEAERRVASAASAIATANPRAIIFAELMEGVRKVAIHRMPRVIPITGYDDTTIAAALKKVGRKRILVIEDNPANIASAQEQLGEAYDLTVVSGFDQALDQLAVPGWIAVLTDCEIPKGGDRCMGTEGIRLVREQGPMPYGPMVLLHAIQAGVKRIGIITSGNHHTNPFVFAFDGLHGFEAGDLKVVCTNRCERPDGVTKDWKTLLNKLQ